LVGRNEGVKTRGTYLEEPAATKGPGGKSTKLGEEGMGRRAA